MKWRLSLKQILVLVLAGSVVWGIMFYAYWGSRSAAGATYIFFHFALVTLLTWLFVFVLDRVAFLIYRR